jgi:hypothetical protein
MSLRASMLAGAALAAVLAPLLLAATSCTVESPACAGQCGPPFQLDVTFRHGTSRHAGLAAMQGCQANPLVIKISMPRPPRHDTLEQWNAIIYTRSMAGGATERRLLRCLHESRWVLYAAWPG